MPFQCGCLSLLQFSCLARLNLSTSWSIMQGNHVPPLQPFWRSVLNVFFLIEAHSVSTCWKCLKQLLIVTRQSVHLWLICWWLHDSVRPQCQSVSLELLVCLYNKKLKRKVQNTWRLWWFRTWRTSAVAQRFTEVICVCLSSYWVIRRIQTINCLQTSRNIDI